MNILADASLPHLQRAFPEPFVLSFYNDKEELKSQLPGQDVLFCRSTLKVNQELLGAHQLHYVATASSGVDHLDQPFLSSQNIQILDAKGSNAPSVADYVVACLAYLDQQCICEIQTSEYENGETVRPLKSLLKLGIIGMGEVGKAVYKRFQYMNSNIKLYDPPRALRDSHFESCALEDLYDRDVLCIHAELHNNPPFASLNLVNSHFLSQLKPGCVIINASRGGIVDEDALIASNLPLTYCTDVYLNEPNINSNIVNRATICTPHIAGHSLEAKWAAVAQISETLHRLTGLEPPDLSYSQELPKIHVKKQESWQELILSFYNPEKETLKLKAAVNKEHTFLKLRKAHQKRHDFSRYSGLIHDSEIRLLIDAVD